MEENKKNNTNTQPTSSKENVVNPTPTKGNTIVIINVLLTLLVVGLGVYIFMTSKKLKEENKVSDKKTNIVKEEKKDEGESEIQVEKEVDKKPPQQKFVGKYIKADLPTGWKIVEYENGDGTTMLDSMSKWEGLTGLQITKGGKEIMRMEAVSGIGFEGGCRELPRFKDYSSEYEAEMIKFAEEMGEKTEILDLTNKENSEFEWLKVRVRRVSNILYQDSVEGKEYFEPPCDLYKIIPTEGPYFKAVGYDYVNHYIHEISSSATTSELKDLDGILRSMELVK